MTMLKCLVWDLDRTLWDGALPERGAASLRPGALEVLAELDARGVLHSIASRNDPDAALRRLAELGVRDYFVAPQLGWADKSGSIVRIAAELGITVDAVGFVDDDPYERDEVRAVLPTVRTFDARELHDLLHLVTGESTRDAARRRELVQRELRRREDEVTFAGTPEQFRASLRLRMNVRPAAAADLDRLAELTERTNQLNSTGILFTREELAALADRADRELLVVELADRYGDYGLVGLSIAALSGQYTIQLLLVSCRVLARGVGTLFLHHLLRTRPAPLRIDLVPRAQNRPLQLLVRFNGFTELARAGDRVLFEHRGEPPGVPDSVHITDTSPMLR
jgi:FkbH-like protein